MVWLQLTATTESEDRRYKDKERQITDYNEDGLVLLLQGDLRWDHGADV